MRPYRSLLLFGLIASLGCRQTYQPPAIANPPNYLVVEGFIETSDTLPTTFTLTHTVRLDTTSNAPELGATVTVEGQENTLLPLIESGNGTYPSYLGSNLNRDIPYRLHIVTQSGKQYASDFIPLVNNPP